MSKAEGKKTRSHQTEEEGEGECGVERGQKQPMKAGFRASYLCKQFT